MGRIKGGGGLKGAGGSVPDDEVAKFLQANYGLLLGYGLKGLNSIFLHTAS